MHIGIFIVEENARLKMMKNITGVKRPTVPTRPADRQLNRHENELESMTTIVCVLAMHWLMLINCACTPLPPICLSYSQMYNKFNAMRFCD